MINNCELVMIGVYYLLRLYRTSAEGLYDSWSYRLFKDPLIRSSVVS